MAQQSYVITVLFNTKDKTLLGRAGKWQSVEEFVRNPPGRGRDTAITPTRPAGSGTTDPGGQFICEDGTLYWCEERPGGGFDKYDCGPCPW